MFELTRLLPLRRLLTEQVPALTGALVLAEMYYKLHSFTLECAAFLLTWYVLDACFGTLRRAVRFTREVEEGRGRTEEGRTA
jgi:hypothetical protein